MNELLSENDREPVLLALPHGASRWLLTVDHAGNAVPASLGTLGVAAADLADHIGIDIGIWEVTLNLAAQLNAPAIGQAYSRLVIDCNRRPGTPASMPLVSDRRAIPGNVDADPKPRIDQIFRPYHAAIADRIRDDTLLAAMHSFTRNMGEDTRRVDIGVIHGPRTRLADAVLEELSDVGLIVERNEPYRIDFAGDYTIPIHAEARGLDYVELEICQDLISDSAGQNQIAALVASALATAQLSLS